MVELPGVKAFLDGVQRDPRLISKLRTNTHCDLKVRFPTFLVPLEIPYGGFSLDTTLGLAHQTPLDRGFPELSLHQGRHILKRSTRKSCGTQIAPKKMAQLVIRPVAQTSHLECRGLVRITRAQGGMDLSYEFYIATTICCALILRR